MANQHHYETVIKTSDFILITLGSGIAHSDSAINRIAVVCQVMQHGIYVANFFFVRITSRKNQTTVGHLNIVNFFSQIPVALPTAIDIVNDNGSAIYLIKEFAEYSCVVLKVSLKQPAGNTVEIVLDFSQFFSIQSHSFSPHRTGNRHPSFLALV